MIHVKIGLEHLTGLWQVVQIVVNKDGQPHLVKHGEECFAGKTQAERDARMRVRWFLKQNFAINDNSDILWEIWPPSLSEGKTLP